MAKVFVQKVGGALEEKQAETLGELKRATGTTNMQAVVNGEPESDDDYAFEDRDHVTFTEKVKGN